MIISIKLLSDLCCYSGEVYNTTVDTDVVYDDYGLPYIPAKRLKGCIREAALELYEMGLMPHYNAIFGKEGSDASAFTISNAKLKNYEEIVNGLNQFEKADFVNQQKVLSLYTYLRTQTAVDTNTGTAIENSLRTLRVLKKGLIFHADVDLKNNDYAEEFKNAVSMVKHMGVSRTRGLGLVELKVKNISGASVKHVLFKENELKNENMISYTIHLKSPLICKSAQGNQAKTEDYIAGSKVLGLIARSMGNDAYQKVMNDIVVSNAYVSLNDNRSLPGRNSLQKIKNQSYVDGKMEIVDMMYFKNDNDKEQRTPANIDYMSDQNEVLSVEKQISYHHQRPSDKSIGRATSAAGQFYQLASICEAQTFKGFIYANRETAKQIMDSVSKLGQVRMGYGRNSEFGQIDFTLDSVEDARNKETLIHDADLLLASDVILYNDNGMLVADVNVLKDYLNAYFGVDDIEIESPFLSYNAIGGFNVTWRRKKQIFSALSKSSCMKIHSDTGFKASYNHSYFVGERVSEGFGEIVLEKTKDTDCVCVYKPFSHKNIKNSNVDLTVINSLLEKEFEEIMDERVREVVANNHMSSDQLNPALSKMRLLFKTKSNYEDMLHEFDRLESANKGKCTNLMKDLPMKVLDELEKEIQKKEYADFKLTWSETKKFDKLYSSYIRELKYRVKAGE